MNNWNDVWDGDEETSTSVKSTCTFPECGAEFEASSDTHENTVATLNNLKSGHTHS